MSRYACNGICKNQGGQVIGGATVSAFLAGTSTPASVYVASSGGTAVNTVTSDSANGSFLFYIDTTDYAPSQTFDIVFSKTNYNTTTVYGVALYNMVSQSLTFASAAEIIAGTEAAKAIAPDQFVSSNVRKLLTGIGDIPYSSAANTLARLVLGAANLKLFVNAGATAPEWAAGFKIGTSTRDMTANSGSASYAGIGFKPSAIIFMMNIAGTLGMTFALITAATIQDCAQYGANTWLTDGAGQMVIYMDISNYQTATLTSMDTDGFTLYWTKGGLPTGTATLGYLCLR